MVDVRPLLFINALAIMLLVTAGFASIRDTQRLPAVSEPLTQQPPQPITIPEDSDVFVAEASPFAPSGDPDAHNHQAAAEPAPAENNRPEPSDKIPQEREALATAAPEASPASNRVNDTESSNAAPRPAPQAIPVAATRRQTSGHLTLRSNVLGDQVTINGQPYGATRLDVTLEPGNYDIEISKTGYSSWTQTVALDAGEELTLVGQLDRYTRVDYRGGTWIGGVRTGDGSYNEPNGLRYEGHFIDGHFHGKGSAWYADGSRYEGDWVEGRREGEGTFTDADNTRYTGQFINDQFNGQGTLSRPNGDILTGQWLNGNLNGHGSLTTGSGMLYVGEFRNGDFHGSGTLTYPDGRSYDGSFSNGKFHGRGTEVFASGKKYEGEYVDGRFHGKGLLLNPNGSSIEATFRHGEPYGQVRLTTAAGEIFTARTSEPGVCFRENSYRATQCPQLDGW